MKHLPHILAALAVFALSAPGLGYRHLWQDEVETAERARTILESGYPRVIDAAGEPSVNTAGREIEDGAAHRYTPWLQFYWAAAGLASSRAVGASPDAGVRLPFVAAHAATSGLASYGLVAAGLSPPAAVAIAVALGAQTVRVVHARTARYHALVDLGVVLGLVGVGLLARRRRAGLAVVAAAVFLLPQIQTLAGAAFALVVGAVAAVRLLQLSPRPERPPVRDALLFVALPGLASLVALLVLTRPWAQAAWGGLGRPGFRGLKDTVQVGYGLTLGAIAVPLLWRRHRAQAIPLAVALATITAIIFVLDLHPFSQPRYYLAAPLLALLWPVYAGLEGWSAGERRVLAVVLGAAVLLPDLVVGPTRRAPFAPFHGVRLAIADAATPASERQPLRRAVDYIREHGAPGDPVLFDYVPQFASWYLPGHPAALVPDATARTPLNAANAVWRRTPRMPRWHVWYEGRPGLWTCTDGCDYAVRDRDDGAGTYELSSARLGTTRRMCVVARLPTEIALNAPSRLRAREAFRPEGKGDDRLVLAVDCDGAEHGGRAAPVGGGSLRPGAPAR